MAIGSVGIGRLVAQLVLDTSQFTSGLSRANNSLATAGRAMQRVGKGLTTFVTLPLLAAGAAGIKLATDFDTAFGKMEGLANVPRKALGGLKSSVLDISEATGRLPQEVADALFFVSSSGYEAAEALEVTKTSADAARAGLGSTAVVADLLTAVVSAYGSENITAAEAADTLTEAVVLGKAEAELMASSLGRVTPIAAQMGIGFDQVAAAVAAMSRKMSASNVSVAVVNLRQLFSDLLNPAKGAEKVLAGFGISVRQLGEMIRQKGLLETLQLLADKLEASGQDFGDILGNVRSLTGALELAGVASQDVEEIFQEMTTSTGMLDRAVAAMANTTGDRARKALASLARAGIDIGNALLPLWEDLVAAVRKVAQWFTTLDESSKRLAVGIAVAFAAAGPAMMALGSLVTVLAAVNVEVVIVIASVAALAAAFIYVRQNWDGLKERVSDWSWWRNVLIDMIQFVVKYNAFSVLAEIVTYAVNVMIREINTFVQKWVAKFNEIRKSLNMDPITIGPIGPTDPLSNPFFAWAEGLESLRAETKEYKNELGSLKDAAIATWEEVKTAMMGLFSRSGGAGGSKEVIPPPTPPQGITGQIGAAFPAGGSSPLKSIVPDATKAKKAVDALSDALQTGLTNAVTEFAESMANAFTGDAGVTGFFNNLLMVTADFLSMLGKALIAAGFASKAFQDLFVNPAGAIAAGAVLVATAGVVKNLLKKGPGGSSSDTGTFGSRPMSRVQGLAVGGVVTSGGVFQLHKDELVSLPTGSAVTPAHMAGGQNITVEVTGFISGYGLGIVDLKENYKRSRMG